jgi:hypothetical protein
LQDQDYMHRLSVPHRDRGERRLSFKNGRWGLVPRVKSILKCKFEQADADGNFKIASFLPLEEGEDTAGLVQEASCAAPTARPARELDLKLYVVLCLASRLLQKWLYQRVMALALYVVTFPLRLVFVFILTLASGDVIESWHSIDSDYRACSG